MAQYKWLILLVLLVGSYLIPLGGQVEAQTFNAANVTDFIDDNGWFHLIGEIDNVADGQNKTVQVQANFFDSGDNLIATASAYTFLHLLNGTDQKSPFDIVLANSTLSSQVSSWGLVIVVQPTATSPYREFSISSITTSKDGSNNTRVEGDIENTGSINATFVQVIATFYDDINTNLVLYANWTYVDPINLTAGETGSFEILGLNSTFNLGNVGDFALVFQCSNYYPTAPADLDADFNIHVLPRSQSVVQGNTATYDVRISRNPLVAGTYLTDFATLSVASGLPEGASYSFMPTNITSGDQSLLEITSTDAIGIGIGNHQLKIRVEIAGVLREVPVILTVLDRFGFGISLDPSSRTISQGNEGTYTITVKSGGGFSSPVTLSVSDIPPDSNANFNPVIVTPTSQGNQSTLTISTDQNTSTGTFNFVVNGTADSQNETTSASITVTVPTEGFFELDIDPGERTVFRGSSTIFTITVQSFNGFNSAVSLEVSGLPSDLTGSFVPSPVTPPANGEQGSTLTITAESDADIDSYALTITGTSTGVATQEVQATISVSAFSEPDFALYVQPTSLSIIQNNSGTATIQVVSVNGFEDSVELSVEGLPNGVTSSIQHPVVAPLPSGNVITKLTIQTSSSANIGNYTFTVKGESDTKTHAQTIELIILNRTFIPPFGQCIIATTTYGSELSPEVQFLRGFRDNRVLSTIAGAEFMKAFNAWYYSFSPQVATWIYDNPVAKGPIKILLAPLLGTLHLSEIGYSTFGYAPELAVTTAGIVASLLIGMIYVGPIVAIAHKKIQYGNMWKMLKLLAIISIGSLFFLAIGLILYLFPLIMLTSSMVVLSMIVLGALLPTLALLKFFERKNRSTN